MRSAIIYVSIFATTIGLVGSTTGFAGLGIVLGVLLGAWYAYLRMNCLVGLGPVWLLTVMAAGGFLGPATDADPYIGALVFGVCYGWLGFWSDRVTLTLFAAMFGLLTGGLAGGVVGAIAAAFLFVRCTRLRSDALTVSTVVLQNNLANDDGDNHKVGIPIVPSNLTPRCN